MSLDDPAAPPPDPARDSAYPVRVIASLERLAAALTANAARRSISTKNFRGYQGVERCFDPRD
jgi:hypothetical protein